MASTFSDLGIELMATGENAGTWGTKTNTNLQIVEKAIAGYVEKSIAGGAQTTTLSITDGDTTESTSVARHAVIKLTGTITGNQIVTVPDSIEKVYIVVNGTSGSFTVQFKTASGTGVTFGSSDKSTKLLFSDGTNIVKQNEYKKWRVVTANETVQAGAQLLVNTNGGAVTITLPASPATGDEVSFIDQGYDFDSNALTVGRNSSNIANAAADLVVNTQGAGFTLVFSGDATTGWTYKEK